MNLTAQIADHIAREIVTGELPPRSRIQELKLAHQLGVSRGSVREALLILEGRHLIEIIPRRGAIVSGLEPEQIGRFATLFGELQVLCLVQLTHRPQLDTTAFKAAFDAMVEAQKENNSLGLIDARQRFLVALIDAVDDYFLRSVVKDLVSVAQRMAYLVMQHPDFDMRDTVRYHHALLDALRERNGDRLRELVSAYERRQCRLAAGCENAGFRA
jgi:DNA-binding GntR family transcriptional regulator